MGHLHYGRAAFEIEDRVLAHLQTVIVQKVRRRDNFLLSFSERRRGVEEQIALWVSHNAHLHFAFSGSRRPELNQRWLEALMHASNSTIGLDLDRVPEADASALPHTA